MYSSHITSSEFKPCSDLSDIVYSMYDIHDLNKYERSKIYDKRSKKNINDNSIRTSKRISIKYDDDKLELFGEVQKIIDQINNSANMSVIYDLIPNDLEIVRYDQGDFFAKHHDFVPIK